MTTDTGWRRDKPGLGIWPHRGKVAFAGWGMSPVDRRWDGVSMDRTLGEFCKVAARAALADAGRGNDYFCASADAAGAAEVSEETRVGSVYEVAINGVVSSAAPGGVLRLERGF